MVDFHTHILPGIDDGCRCVEESLEMIRIEAAHGVKTIFLTPHFDAQEYYPEQFLQKRNDAWRQLSDALADNEAIDFVLGAEVMYYPGMSRWEQLPQLSLGKTGYILIEMPGSKLSNSFLNELKDIYYDRNLTPIIAHVERYFHPMHVRKLMDQLGNLPVLVQMNGYYLINRSTRKSALRLLQQGRIHLIGSDCHRPTWRKPCMNQVAEIFHAYLNTNTIQNISLTSQAVLYGNKIFN